MDTEHEHERPASGAEDALYTATITLKVAAADEIEAAEAAHGYANVLENAGAHDVRVERID